MVILVSALLILVLAGLLWRDYFRRAPKPRKAPGPTKAQRQILIDGSNVMWWQDDTPRISALVAVVDHLQARGYHPGVIFDASAGHRLFGRYRDDHFFAAALGLTEPQIFVVPKGEIADRFLLTLARERGLSIVTNDRYRDWQEAFPEIGPSRLCRGGFREGKLWLEDVAAVT